MENVNPSGLPSNRDSTKYFLLSQNPPELMPFRVVPLEILTPNGRGLVEDFRESTGEFLGGGVMKSKDFEAEARKKPNAVAIRKNLEKQIAQMPKGERIRMSTYITSEWIAFEYALVISVTIYGLIVSIKWDQIEMMVFSKKGFFGQAQATITYRDKLGQLKSHSIQSSNLNISSLMAIAQACGVLVK